MSQPKTQFPIAGRSSSGMSVLVLNGQVGDAASGIQCPVRQDALRRAGVDAAGARAAVVGFERRIRLERISKQDFGQQEIGSVLRVDQAGVFADPAQTGAHGEVAFQQGTGIRVPAVGNGLTGLRFDEARQRLEAFRASPDGNPCPRRRQPPVR